MLEAYSVFVELALEACIQMEASTLAGLGSKTAERTDSLSASVSAPASVIPTCTPTALCEHPVALPPTAQALSDTTTTATLTTTTLSSVPLKKEEEEEEEEEVVVEQVLSFTGEEPAVVAVPLPEQPLTPTATATATPTPTPSSNVLSPRATGCATQGVWSSFLSPLEASRRRTDSEVWIRPHSASLVPTPPKSHSASLSAPNRHESRNGDHGCNRTDDIAGGSGEEQEEEAEEASSTTHQPTELSPTDTDFAAVMCRRRSCWEDQLSSALPRGASPRSCQTGRRSLFLPRTYATSGSVGDLHPYPPAAHVHAGRLATAAASSVAGTTVMRRGQATCGPVVSPVLRIPMLLQVSSPTSPSANPAANAESPEDLTLRTGNGLLSRHIGKTN